MRLRLSATPDVLEERLGHRFFFRWKTAQTPRFGGQLVEATGGERQLRTTPTLLTLAQPVE